MKSYNEIANIVFERREQYEAEKMKKRKILVKTLMTVCCFCLVVIMGGLFWQGGILDIQPTATTDIVTESIIKDWQSSVVDNTTTGTNIQNPVTTTLDSDKNETIDTTEITEDNKNITNNIYQSEVEQPEVALDKYYDYEVTQGQFYGYIGGKVIDENKISGKISDIMVLAGWKNGNSEWLTKENLQAEVFTIENIGNDVAVALKFIDMGEALTTTHYYVIMNPEADLSAVKDYIILSSYDNSGEVAGEDNIISSKSDNSFEIIVESTSTVF